MEVTAKFEQASPCTESNVSTKAAPTAELEVSGWHPSLRSIAKWQVVKQMREAGLQRSRLKMIEIGLQHEANNRQTFQDGDQGDLGAASSCST